MTTDPDVIITSEENIKSLKDRQGIFHASVSFYIASGFVMAWGIAAMVVILHAYFTAHDAPTWAVALESSTITAALAIVFRDQIPHQKKLKKPNTPNT